MSTPTKPEGIATSLPEASRNQGLDITESNTAVKRGSQEEIKAPEHGPKEATTSVMTATPLSAETKESLEEVSEKLRVDAEQAVEEMKKRAARYMETPKDSTDECISAQMEGLQINDKLAVYEETFASHPVAIGKAISKMEREETDRNGDSTLVYGEITFKTLALALHKIKTKYGLPGVGSSGKKGVLQGDGGAFYDIGSGTGKPVIAAAIFHSFEKAVGIEILEGLHATSMEILKQWEGGLRDRIGHDPPTSVKFIHGNALDLSLCDWTDGDVVFANSTCFDDGLMLKLASAATAMKKGSIFITLTKRIPAAYFTVLEHEMFPMSWGSATVYISQKTTEPFGDPNKVNNEIGGVLAGDHHRLGTAGSVYSGVGVSGRGFDIDIESERTE